MGYGHPKVRIEFPSFDHATVAVLLIFTPSHDSLSNLVSHGRFTVTFVVTLRPSG